MEEHTDDAALPDPEDRTTPVDPAQLERLISQIAAAGSPAAGEAWSIGPYRLIEELGRGSMGTVHRACHEKLGREVALKVLPHAIAGDDGARRRFLREARAMARVEHPNVVQIHDVIEQGGNLAIAMERIDGMTLAAILGHLREESSAPPTLAAVAAALEVDRDEIGESDYGSWVARIGLDLANALQAVHDVGLTHRDVKPSNVLVDRQGRAHLADFGVVRDADASVTRTGGFIGTAPYAAPEQLRGSHAIGPGADVYGLGATLYETFALEPPVSGSPATILDAVQRGAIPPLRGRIGNVDRDLALVVHHALEPEEERRYPSALAFAADLRAFLDGRAVSVRPTTRLERLALWAKREPGRARLAAIATGAMLGLLILGGYLLAQLPRIHSAQLAETLRRYDEFVNVGFTALSAAPAEREATDREDAITSFRTAIRMLPGEPIAIGGLAMALAVDDRADEARAVLDANQDLVEGAPSLGYLRSTGIELLGFPPDQDLAMLDDAVDPLSCFFAALAAAERARSCSIGERRAELQLNVVALLQCAVDLSREPPRIFRAALANAAATAGDTRTARRQIAVLRREWLDPPHEPSPSVALQVAQALDLIGDLDDALAICDSPVVPQPLDGIWLILKTDILTEFGRDEEVIQLLQSRSGTTKHRHQVMQRLAKAYERTGDKDAAQRCRTHQLMDLESAQQNADREGRAASSLRLAILDVRQELDPEFDPVPALREFAQRFPTSWRIHGRLCYELAMASIAQWQKVRGLQRARRTELAKRAKADYAAIVAEATSASHVAVEFAPYHIEVLRNASLLELTVAHEYDDALPLLDRMERIDPSDVAIAVTRGTTLHMLRRFEEAAAVLLEACEDPRADVEAHGTLGWTLLELDRVAEASAAFARCAELAEQSRDPKKQRSWSLQSRVGQALCVARSADGQTDAIAEAVELLESVPETPLAADCRLACAKAEVLIAAGKDDEAQTWLDRAERARLRAAEAQLLDVPANRLLESGRLTIERTRQLLK